MPTWHRPGVSATSVVAHIEEVVLATSGEDAFELVFGVAATRVVAKSDAGTSARRATAKGIARMARAHSELGITLPRDASEALLARIDALLGPRVRRG